MIGFPEEKALQFGGLSHVGMIKNTRRFLCNVLLLIPSRGVL